MRRVQAFATNAIDALAVVAAGTISIYLVGIATALGRDHFLPQLAAFAIILALWARDLLSKHSLPPYRRPLHPIAILLGFFTVGLIVSTILVDIFDIRHDTDDTYRQISMLSIGLVPFMLAYRVAGRQSPGTAIMWMAHLVLAVCAVSIGLEAAGITSYESYGDRYFGFLSDPSALMLTFPVIVYAATEKRILVGFSLIFLFLTLSRGPLVFALVGVMALLIFRQGKARKPAALIVGVGLMISTAMSEAVLSLVQRFAEIDLDEGRFKTTAAGLELFNESPLFGHGYAALGYYYPAYDDRQAWVFGRFRDGVFPTASSTWVQMLSDGGILLAVPYFILIVVTARYCIPRLRMWLTYPYTKPLAGAAVWLLIIFFLNQSSGWFLAGGVVLPLIMTTLGLIAGSLALQGENQNSRRRASQ